ncbi:hypothetical protein [Lysobacter claricitrinus]|uniref:hypothetical protein n=1 Tax=Lysobacter claricitrinus TaxID=3367728 RepID=UPI0037DB3E38
MPFQDSIRGEWSRLVLPVFVLVASVAACSAMGPADAGVAHACRQGNADAWVGRAASADIVEQARQASGSRSVRLVMPEQSPHHGLAHIDRLNLYLDDRALITRTACG